MEPLELGIICPSCGIQYGVSDEDKTYAELRRQWINAAYAQWWSCYTPPPAGWSAAVQLQNIGYVCTPADLQRINGKETALAASQP